MKMGLKEDVIDMKKEVEDLEQQSLVSSIMSDYKRQNKRLYIIWIITFIAFCSLLCYTIYLLNDINSIETTEVSQDTSDGNNSYIGNNGDINYGITESKED